MSTLEQVKLLETKVTKAIDYVNHLTGENTMLREKLEGYQTRIDELEVLIMRFKEDQGKVESGILSALDRLNQFEDAIEKGVSRIRSSGELIPKEDKTNVQLPLDSVVSENTEKAETPVSSSAESIVSPIEADIISESSKNDDMLFSETTPAENDDVSFNAEVASEEATIMAALEAEEQAVIAKAKNVGEQTDASSPSDVSPEAELDIF
jgi:chromosome segregation ATPase